ncbi:lipid-A-disaccharide synthase [Trichloromonas sp.]|uniref:lipid-A-disaccharide synthase n=1 Tax=Trichloromonas sp. TaxID=3069249 RepID=UPI003D818AEB
MFSGEKRRKALIVTGEASGDLHGANLIEAARKIDPELNFFGVGGSRMQSAGCEILIPGDTISVMGLIEVVGHFPVIYRAFQTLKSILQGADRPDVLICIDFPDFNLRLAKEAKRVGIPVLYYVSPQVWAWRRGRVKKIARVVDRLAAILPFEPEFYRGLDIEVEYVGNPLLDEAVVEQSRETLRNKYEVAGAGPVIGLFPGSRRNELRYNFDTILWTAELVLREEPQARFLLPVASSLCLKTFEDRLSGSGLPVVPVEDSIYDVANACDAVLCVSGTVTLQTALVGTPMAILYKMAPLTYEIGRRLVRVPFIGLVNIVAGEGVVKEFVQHEASEENLSRELLRMVRDSEYASGIRAKLSRVREKMGEPGCSSRVAEMASEMSRGIVRRGRCF